MRIPWLKEKYESLISNFSWDIGVDLGSSNTVIYLKDKGIVVEEPTLIARHKRKKWTGLSAPRAGLKEPVAYGCKAKEMLNREPKGIEVINPIKNGIISDLEAAENLISYYLKLIYEVPSKYPKLFKPRVVVGVPGSINQVQKRAVKSIFINAGARQVILVEDVVLAAIGLGLPIENSSGLVILDIGGGKTEVNLVAMGGVVIGRGIKTASGDLDLSIMNYIKMKYGLLIGPNSAERIKIELANFSDRKGKEKKTAVVRGRDLETGLPKSINLTEGEIGEAVSLDVSRIVKLVSNILDETPPEMVEDILKRGIIMVGNGSRIKGIDRLIELETKISTKAVDDPGLCVIRGCEELIRNPALLKQIKLISNI